MLIRVPVQNLQPGMVLGEDIYSKDALVLISRGKSLDLKIIESIKNRFPEMDSVLIFKEDKSKNGISIQSPISLSTVSPVDSSTINFKNLTLDDIQSLVQDIFSNKREYQETRRLINELKSDISEGFELLIENHEINDEKFLSIAKKVLSFIQAEKNTVNPGYLYLIELEHWHPDTFNHSIDVAFFTLFIASQFTNDAGELSSLFLGGLLHDIGKYMYFKSGDSRFYQIITKTGPLTDEEYYLLQKHVDVEKFFIDKFKSLPKKEKENIMYGALDHHEKLDGKGYLKNKRGYQISLAGRIIAVADIYDAMVRKREYKSMVRPDIAIRHVISLSENGKLDKQFTMIFKNLMGLYPTGSVISTSHGFAIVTNQTQNPDRPFVMLIEEHEKGEIDLNLNHEIDIYEEIED